MTIKAITLLVAATAIYFQDLTIIISGALDSEITNYMLAIFPIIAYLIFGKGRC
ncbi:MAG: hypothetical protein QXD95_08165 [Nitrososphaeria archaeon]